MKFHDIAYLNELRLTICTLKEIQTRMHEAGWVTMGGWHVQSTAGRLEVENSHHLLKNGIVMHELDLACERAVASLEAILKNFGVEIEPPTQPGQADKGKEK